MTTMKKKTKYLALAVSALLVLLDQIFKILAVTYLSPIPTLPIIQDVFHLTYLENRGAAFGILSGKGIFLVVLTSTIIVIAIIFLLSGKIKDTFFIWSLSLIIGGGVGNLIDRIFRQYVVDYLDFRIINFAVFNFADCCVVIGTLLFMGYILFYHKQSSQPVKELPADDESN